MVLPFLSECVIAGAAAELAVGVSIVTKHRTAVLAGDRVICLTPNQIWMAVPILHPATV